MPKELFPTDIDVEIEIERLSGSEYVKLARREKYLQNKRRQHMYTLRCLERRGRELAKAGVTLESLNAQLQEMEGEETDT